MNVRPLKKLGFSVAVFGAAAFSLIPFLLFVSSAFKTQTEVTAIPPQIWPSFSLAFFRSAIVRYDILKYLVNSVIVAGSTTVVTVFLGALAGYGLARLPRRWSQLTLMVILACAMFPQIAIVGPIWRFLRFLGWLNTYQGLILPYVALTLPLAIWILALFFGEMPEELEAAALVDGCTRLQALVRVIVPLSAPGLFTAAILTFIYAWNEFFLALLIVTDPVRQTMPVGIALFQGEHTVPWGEIAAASLITTAPLVIMVLLFQRRIVSGLSAGAIKG
ncbi:MAG: carbohydrate ABC transporter permease [Thermodesulfobacteriota bacterium]|nr:carbohydrate ABC transporter permease [Thermodesulfobacteriota bacterium]